MNFVHGLKRHGLVLDSPWGRDLHLYSLIRLDLPLDNPNRHLPSLDGPYLNIHIYGAETIASHAYETLRYILECVLLFLKLVVAL